MQRVLDPAQIEAFATQRAIPRIRLPDPARVFSDRAARLLKLSEGHAVGDYLRLMAAVAKAQQDALEKLLASSAGGLVSAQDQQRMQQAREHGMPLLEASGWPRDSTWRTILLELCDAIGAAPGFPGGVAATCRRIRELSTEALDEQARLLLHSADHGIDAQAAPFIMAALQVYWTRMVCTLSHDVVANHVGNVDVPGVCPVCGTLPVASIVRAEKAYQGYRYLHCSLCATEWHMVRVKCSHCESTAGIHYHSIDTGSIESGSAALRAEACDSCKTYRKICYQEHDMAVEPVADDLGSLALDLLMSEAGFHRGSGNPLLWQSS
jgi:FdhE protein